MNGKTIGLTVAGALTVLAIGGAVFIGSGIYNIGADHHRATAGALHSGALRLDRCSCRRSRAHRRRRTTLFHAVR
jgi:hypothetical protein